MRCEECLPRIEEYVDGELDGRMLERMETHLSTCAECARELDELKREQEIYAHYQRGIEVTPAQWNIVQARIEQEKDAWMPQPQARLRELLGAAFGSGRKFRPAFVAALLLIAVGITAGVLYLNSVRPQNNIASKPPTPTDSNLPIGAAGALPPAVASNANNQTIVQEINPEKNNPGNQTPIVASSTPRRKKTTNITISSSFESRRIKQLPLTARKVLDPLSPQTDVARLGPVNSGLHTSRASVITNAPEARGDFNFEIARHIERAELLLRSFRNVRLPATNRALDVSYEKEDARKLLYRNIALRRDADGRGDQPTTEILNTLEPILLDIANLPGRARARDVRSIEQRMEKKEIVATLQVRTLVAAN